MDPNEFLRRFNKEFEEWFEEWCEKWFEKKIKSIDKKEELKEKFKRASKNLEELFKYIATKYKIKNIECYPCGVSVEVEEGNKEKLIFGYLFCIKIDIKKLLSPKVCILVRIEENNVVGEVGFYFKDERIVDYDLDYVDIVKSTNLIKDQINEVMSLKERVKNLLKI